MSTTRTDRSAQDAPAQVSTVAAVRWLLRTTADLLPPLALACLLACLTRFASVGIYLVAGLGLIRATGLTLPNLPIPGWGVLLALLVVLGLAKGALRYAEQYVGHRVAFLALARLRQRIYQAAERQAPVEARRRSSGGLLAVATRDVDRVEVFYAHTLPPAVSALVVSTTVIWWVWASFGVAPALVLLAGHLLVGLVIPLLGLGTLRRAAAAQARVRGVQSQQLTETLAGIDVVHGFTAGPRMLARFNAAAAPAIELDRKASRVTGLRSTLTQLAVWGSALGLVAVALLQADTGGPGMLGTTALGASAWGPAALILLLAILLPSYEAVRTVDGFVLGLQDSLSSAQRLYATALGQPPVPEPSDPVDLPATGPLRVRGLGVNYAAQQVLDAVDLDLAPGQLVAVVGDSGSGKSTLAASLVRSIPATGEISFGEVLVERAALSQLRERIILVSQAAVMVRGTVRDNLLLGLRGIDDTQLHQLLEELGLGDWLAAQPDGLDTRLGDRSTRLSGGQRQRLALARALLREPAVLILDESTSALDAQSEALVLRAIDRRRAAGLAVLLISHRLSILRGADTILVLRGGRVVETGTPQALLGDPDSLFARMAIREADRILPSAGTRNP